MTDIQTLQCVVETLAGELLGRGSSTTFESLSLIDD